MLGTFIEYSLVNWQPNAPLQFMRGGLTLQLVFDCTTAKQGRKVGSIDACALFQAHANAQLSLLCSSINVMGDGTHTHCTH